MHSPFFVLFRFFFQDSSRRFCLILFQVVCCLSTIRDAYKSFFIVIECARSLTPIDLMHDESH